LSQVAGLMLLPESMCVVHIGHDWNSYSVVYPHPGHRIWEVILSLRMENGKRQNRYYCESNPPYPPFTKGGLWGIL